MEWNRGFKRVFSFKVFLLKVAMKFVCWRRAETSSEGLAQGKTQKQLQYDFKEIPFSLKSTFSRDCGQLQGCLYQTFQGEKTGRRAACPR